MTVGIDKDEEQIEERCEGLVRRGQFLAAAGQITWPDGTVTVGYTFLHPLYQQMLYERVSTRRRQRLHQQIGRRLEKGYKEQAREMAAELALHFAEGQDYQRAVVYHQQAAENAIRLHAPREAVNHLRKGLEVLTALPDTMERTQHL